jgi:hypothetical protein
MAKDNTNPGTAVVEALNAAKVKTMEAIRKDASNTKAMQKQCSIESDLLAADRIAKRLEKGYYNLTA